METTAKNREKLAPRSLDEIVREIAFLGGEPTTERAAEWKRQRLAALRREAAELWGNMRCWNLGAPFTVYDLSGKGRPAYDRGWPSVFLPNPYFFYRDGAPVAAVGHFARLPYTLRPWAEFQGLDARVLCSARSWHEPSMLAPVVYTRRGS